MTRRQQAAALSYSSLVLFFGAVVSNQITPATRWIAGRLPPGVTYSQAYWGAIGLAAAIALAASRVWRCPHCGATPGPVYAPHCRACGKPLGDGSAEVGGELLAAPVEREPPPIEPVKAAAFNHALHRVVRFHRMGSWKRLLPFALLLGVAGGVVSLLVEVDRREPFGMAALLGALTAFLGYVIIHNIVEFMRTTALARVRCPGCSKGLSSNLGEFCPFCGIQIPYDQTLKDIASGARLR